MASVHIQALPRKSGMRWRVRYRLGGGRASLIHGGTFKNYDAALATKEQIEMAIASGKLIELPSPTKEKMVYIARLGSLLKIGSSVDPEVRVRSLNAELLWSGSGGLKREKRLHEAFAKYRVRGEWFQAADEILDYVEMQRRRREAA